MAPRLPRKTFNFKRYCRRHIALHLGYYGNKYHGMALQTSQKKTVEHELFCALKKTCLIEDISSANFSRCGRTDSGVSAIGQIVTLTVRSVLPYNQLPKENRYPAEAETNADDNLNEKDTKEELDYATILNAILPRDIFVFGWADCPSPSYQARFKAQSRTYRYFFSRRNLDIELMKKAAADMEGEHDFSNFCKIDVMSSEICGNAFLWHQIRAIMAVLFFVGRRLEDPQIVRELLDTKSGFNQGRPTYKFANESPLVLHQSDYPDLNFHYSYKSLQRLYTRLEERKLQLTLKLAHVNNTLEKIDNFDVADENESQKIHKFSEIVSKLECDYEEANWVSKKENDTVNRRKSLRIKKYITLAKRGRCDTYKSKLQKLTDEKRQKLKDIRG